MALNWTQIGMFALLVIILLGFITTSSSIFSNDQKGIVDAQARLSCPLPEFNNDKVSSPVSGQFGQYWSCNAVESPPSSDNWSIATGFFPRTYNATIFDAIPIGSIEFTGDYLGAIFLKIGAVLFFLLAFLTPIEFNVFGFGLEDIGGAGAAFVLMVYVFCYTAVGVMIYRAVNPLAGGS